MTDNIVALDGDAVAGETGTTSPQTTEEKLPQKEHEPPPDHPRFKEVYGKMKNYERELEQSKQDIEALRKHNEALFEVVTKVEDKVIDSSKPDKETDPLGYENWLIEKGKREYRKETQKIQAKPVVLQPQRQQVDTYEAAMRIAHDDYDTVIAVVNSDMARDPVLRNEILSMSSEEKFRYAYDYGQKRIAKLNKSKQQTLDQGYVEGGTPPPQKGSKLQLTEDEKIHAKRFGISEDKWLKQKQFIAARGY